MLCPRIDVSKNRDLTIFIGNRLTGNKRSITSTINESVFTICQQPDKFVLTPSYGVAGSRRK